MAWGAGGWTGPNRDPRMDPRRENFFDRRAAGSQDSDSDSVSSLVASEFTGAGKSSGTF